jgi:hypothetical protein
MASEHLVVGLPADIDLPSHFPSDFPTGLGAGSPSVAQLGTAPATASRSPIDWSARFADIENPEHHVAALGARPAFVNGQRRYDRVARSIDTYRERFDVAGPDPLGPRPFESFPRLAYDYVAAQIRDYEKVRWRELTRQPPGIEARDIGAQEIAGMDVGLEL